LRAQIHQYDQVIKERTQQQEEIKSKSACIKRGCKPARLSSRIQTADSRPSGRIGYYSEMVKKRDQSEVGSGSWKPEKPALLILDAANLPDSPSFPNCRYLPWRVRWRPCFRLGLTLLLELQDTTMRSNVMWRLFCGCRFLQ